MTDQKVTRGDKHAMAMTQAVATMAELRAKAKQLTDDPDYVAIYFKHLMTLMRHEAKGG